MKNGKGIAKTYETVMGVFVYTEEEYLNGEKNGKRKRYKENKDGILLFEGENENGKINGMGKTYDSDGKLQFEGEFFDNHRIKGKYYIKGRLEYEGDFLYDRKFNGKGYDENGNIIYQLINGNGTVNEYYKNGVVFKGEFLNGKRNGKGKIYSKEKLIFETEYFDGKIIGKVREYNLGGILVYEGEYLNGKRNGKEKNIMKMES